MSRTYLYCRVSTGKQSTDTQEHDLRKRFPDGIIVSETASGVKTRPELDKLFQRAQKGDTIAVVALDRLGRKLTEIIDRIEDLCRRGVSVISLREGVDYGTPTGRMVIQIMVSTAEFERSLIGQRTSATLQAMKAKGIKVGRPPKFTPEVIEKAKELNDMGHSYRQIAKITGMSPSSLCQLFKTAA